MAAPFKNKNALGNSGGGAPSSIDREKSKKLRNLAIDEMIAFLEMPKVKMKQDDYELYKAILIKLAGSVLPRLNEHTGEDGEPLQVIIPQAVANRFEIKKDDTITSKAGGNDTEQEKI